MLLQTVLFFDTYMSATTNNFVFQYSHECNYSVVFSDVSTRVGSGEIRTLYAEYKTGCSEII